jgi:hypothetical protein
MDNEQKKRFYSKVSIPWDNMVFGCWEWTAGRTRHNYGAFYLNSRTLPAHRVSYLLWNGQFPNNFACHECDNPCCVNPLHLWDGTPKENTNDMILKGRKHKDKGIKRPTVKQKGSENNFSKLTEDQVLDIRIRENQSYQELAKEFNMSRTSIFNIINRKSWAHI